MLVYHASCTLSFLATQKRPDFCRDAFEDVKNDKQEMPKMECKRQGSVSQKRETAVPAFCSQGETRESHPPERSISTVLVSIAPCAEWHELDFPIRGFCAPVAVMQFMLTTVIAFWASIIISYFASAIQYHLVPSLRIFETFVKPAL